MIYCVLSRQIYVFVLLLITGICTCVFGNDDLVVETHVGSIRGLRADDGNYTMFMGIPFATIDELNPFGASSPYPPFEGIFEAKDDSAMCPQVDQIFLTTVGSLDCLRLNIYVPDSARHQNPVPVMVYIYGGAFSVGSARKYLFGPQFIVRHDVILVTFNYRVGPYGFMCLGTPEIPGNAGLKDQLIALRWIQNNIHFFGGDTNRITVFGNSAGGMSGALHLLSEHEELFTDLIMQSGTAFFLGGLTYDRHGPILDLARELQLETNDVNEAVSFLSTADVHSVARASQGLEFRPCVEKQFPGVERFLAENALNSNHSKVSGVSVMVGYNNAELLLMFPINAPTELWATWENLFSTALSNFDFEETKRAHLQNIVRQFYVGDEEITNEVRQQVLDFFSDTTFVYSSIRTIQPYLYAGAAAIYQYVFSYDGNRNFFKILNNVTAPGAAHADETGYLFKMDFIPDVPTAADQLIIDRMTTMWTNFAKYRNPTPETSTLLPVNWEPITKGSPYHYLEIDSEMRAGMRYAHDRMSFWDLFYKSFRKYERGFDEQNSEDENDDSVVPDSAALAILNPYLLLFFIMVNIIIFACSLF